MDLLKMVYYSPNYFFSHLLIYGSIFSAITSYLFIYIVYKFKIIKLPKFMSNVKEALLYGLASALMLSFLVVIYWFFQDYSFKFAVNWPSVFGNIFSNFYEEVSYRALLVGVTLALFRNKWIAVVIPSLIMVSTHTQYPLEFKCIVFLGSCVFSYVYIKTSNLVSPWSSHQASDMILDTVLKV